MPQKPAYLFYFVLLSALCALFFIADVLSGSVYISMSDIFSSENKTAQNIIYNIRIPKAITAMLSGAGLSVCGLMMQTLFRNPLAGPFVLGVSSGASLGVAVLTLLLTGSGFLLGIDGKISFIIAASFGAATALLFVITLSKNIRNDVTILIIGLMVSHLAGAIEGVLQYMSNAENLQVFILWGMGSFSNVVWSDLYFFMPIILTATAIAFFFSKPLNILLWGENYAQSMGLNIKKTRLYLILLTALIAGCITAFCGPIAFIGIAIPHLARAVFKTSDHKILIPATILTGAAITLCCDIITHLPGSVSSLPVNAITSLIGAPIVIWVVWKKNNYT